MKNLILTMIMAFVHCVDGLQKLGLLFELKGGISISISFELIHCFSHVCDLSLLE